MYCDDFLVSFCVLPVSNVIVMHGFYTSCDFVESTWILRFFLLISKQERFLVSR